MKVVEIVVLKDELEVEAVVVIPSTITIVCAAMAESVLFLIQFSL